MTPAELTQHLAARGWTVKPGGRVSAQHFVSKRPGVAKLLAITDETGLHLYREIDDLDRLQAISNKNRRD